LVTILLLEGGARDLAAARLRNLGKIGIALAGATAPPYHAAGHPGTSLVKHVSLTVCCLSIVNLESGIDGIVPSSLILLVVKVEQSCVED